MFITDTVVVSYIPYQFFYICLLNSHELRIRYVDINYQRCSLICSEL